MRCLWALCITTPAMLEMRYIMEDSEIKNDAAEQNKTDVDKKSKTDKPKEKKNRIQGLKAEFKRIVWPDKDTIIKETTAVVVVTVILGAIIALLDLAIKTGLDKIFQIG